MDSVDSKLVQAVILLDRQFRLIQQLVDRHAPALVDLEASIEGGTTSLAHVLDVYNYVLALIDHLARYQKTAYSIPRLNHKNTEYRALSRALGNVKDKGPLLGGICWISGRNQFLVGLQDVGRQRSSPSIAYEVHEGKYLSKFCFTYGDTCYNLGGALVGVQAFNEYVMGVVCIELDGNPYESQKHFMALCATFVRSQVGDGSSSETEAPV